MNANRKQQESGLNFPPELVVGVVVGEQLLEQLIGGRVKGRRQQLHVVLVKGREERHEGRGEDGPRGGHQVGHVDEQIGRQGGGNRAPVVPLSGYQTQHTSQCVQTLVGCGRRQKMPQKSKQQWNRLVGEAGPVGQKQRK